MKKKDQPNIEINFEALIPKKAPSKVIYKTKPNIFYQNLFSYPNRKKKREKFWILSSEPSIY